MPEKPETKTPGAEDVKAAKELEKATRESKPKISTGRIVLVVTAQAVKGKETIMVRRPAIVSNVAGETIDAHVFVDGAKDADYCMTQFRTGLTFDEKSKTIGTWSWPDRA